MRHTKHASIRGVLFSALLFAFHCECAGHPEIKTPTVLSSVNVRLISSADRGAQLTGSIKDGLPVRITLRVGLSTRDLIRDFFFDENGRLQWVSELTLMLRWDESLQSLDETSFKQVSSTMYRFKTSGELECIMGDSDADDLREKGIQLNSEALSFADALRQPEKELELSLPPNKSTKP